MTNSIDHAKRIEAWANEVQPSRTLDQLRCRMSDDLNDTADYIRQLEGLVGEAVPGMKADSTYPDKAVSGPADKWLNTVSTLGLMKE